VTHSNATLGRLQPRSTAPTCVHTNGVILGRARATAPDHRAIAALWGETWRRLRAEYPDVEESTASLPPAVHRLEASAARWAGRVVRGEADLVEFEAKLSDWEDAVIASLAAKDQARSLRTCGDCGAPDTATHATGLTGVRACSRCLKETTTP
jgi:hypothetical protein